MTQDSSPILDPARRSMAKTAGASERTIARALARVDELVSRQVDAILHHAHFQGLEARWRGLRSLVDSVAGSRSDSSTLHIELLDVRWKELRRDLVVSWEASIFFDKVYTRRFGMAGALPFGLLVGDFHVRADVQDMHTLREIAHVAAAAFAPFVAAAHPSLLGLGEDFGELERVLDLDRLSRQPTLLAWRALRSEPDARFVALTLPRVLMRGLYRRGFSATRWITCSDCKARVFGPAACRCGSKKQTSTRLGFTYAECEESRSSSDFLWGNGALWFARVVARCFLTTGWHLEIRGVTPSAPALAGAGPRAARGLLDSVPRHDLKTDGPSVDPVAGVEVLVGQWYERELACLGFIPITRTKRGAGLVIAATPSVQLVPSGSESDPAVINARLSGMLHYVLCASRFAHAIKVMFRDMIGGSKDRLTIERDLHAWVHNYVAPDDNLDETLKARFPLREARVTLEEDPRSPGVYQCRLHLRPHAELDAVGVTMQLTTRLAGSSEAQETA